MSLVLTDSGEKLEITATVVIPFTVHYADYVGATPVFTPGVAAGDTINGTKDLLVAPGSGQRVVRTITVHNDSGGADMITIQLDDGGVNYTIITVSLPDEYTLCYDEDGWCVLDSDGAVGTTLFTHAILGPHHSDAATDAVSRGSLIYGNATPAWDELVHPGATYHLQTDANDIIWSQDLLMADDHFVGATGDIRIEFDSSSGYIKVHLGDAAGSDQIRILDSGSNLVTHLDSNGNVDFKAHMAVGALASINANYVVVVTEQFTANAGFYVSVNSDAYLAPTANFTTELVGMGLSAQLSAAQVQTGGQFVGVRGVAKIYNNVAGTLLLARGGQFYIDAEDGTITVGESVHLYTPLVDTGICVTGSALRITQGGVGAGSITTLYGIYMDTITVGDTNYAIYSSGGDSHHAGKVSIGGTVAPLAQLHVDQGSASGAIPVLYLDQGDVSEEMIEFACTIGVGNAIEAVGGKTLTTTHFIKISLPGALTRYIPVGTIA